MKWHKIFMERKSEKFFFKIKFSLNEFWECNMMLLFGEVTHETRIKGEILQTRSFMFLFNWIFCESLKNCHLKMFSKPL